MEIMYVHVHMVEITTSPKRQWKAGIPNNGRRFTPAIRINMFYMKHNKTTFTRYSLQKYNSNHLLNFFTVNEVHNADNATKFGIWQNLLHLCNK